MLPSFQNYTMRQNVLHQHACNVCRKQTDYKGSERNEETHVLTSFNSLVHKLDWMIGKRSVLLEPSVPNVEGESLS